MINSKKAQQNTQNYWTKKLSGSKPDQVLEKILYVLELKIDIASSGGLTQIREIVNLPHDEGLWKTAKETVANPLKEKLKSIGFKVSMDCFLTEENGVIGLEIDW